MHVNCPNCSKPLTEKPSGMLECTTCRTTLSRAAAASDVAPGVRAQARGDRILSLDYTKKRGHA